MPRSPRRRRGLALLAFLALGSAAAVPAQSPAAVRIVPALGSYLASGKGDPATYSVRGQVKRAGGRRSISLQVRDTCGGLATFAGTAIVRSGGAPAFSAQVGVARVSGRWVSSTRVVGSVKTPCGRAQGYSMRRTG
jgi:hypothetical protein